VNLNFIEKNFNFLNRVDFKYIINFHNLPLFLLDLQKDYKVLEINNNRIFTYDNKYFDTEDHIMYMHHHNGKLVRYKIRIRNYIETSLKYLEIKQKTYNSKCIKYRLKLDESVKEETIRNFIENHSPYTQDQLFETLNTQFKRITLVNEQFIHRLTIDFKLIFKNSNIFYLPEIGIIEIKSLHNNNNGLIKDLVNKYFLKQSNFSKYCIGKILTDKNIKYNNFKETLLIINKIKKIKLL